MAGVALALAASLAWGTADFGGGLLARRFHVVAVSVVSQAAGFVALVVVAGAAGSLNGEGVLIGFLARGGGGAGAPGVFSAPPGGEGTGGWPHARLPGRGSPFAWLGFR